MTLGGLFSGIGGFELAAQRAGITPLWSNEIDPFCCKVLRKNFSHEIIEADIRTIGKGREHELQPVDIICGGFPCQPFSSAGNRKGKEDNRFLWPEMLRTIREVRPTWVVGENVAGLLTMDGGAVFEEICSSLEDENYQVEPPYIVPACAVGAPHRRDRVWIIAHSHNCDARLLSGSLQSEDGRERIQQEQRVGEFGGTDQAHTSATHTKHKQRNRSMDGDAGRIEFADSYFYAPDASGQRFGKTGIDRQRPTEWPTGSNTALTDSDSIGTEAVLPDEWPLPFRGDWSIHWLQVATSLCRMDDGVPAWVDSSRTNRLKGGGNAIVPHVAQVFFEIILQFENSK